MKHIRLFRLRQIRQRRGTRTKEEETTTALLKILIAKPLSRILLCRTIACRASLIRQLALLLLAAELSFY